MAWTAPRTWSTGEIVSASIMNVHVRDNLLFLANPPKVRAYHNATQSISNTTLTAVALNSERYDTDTMHDTVTNNSRLTCKTAGLFLITGIVSWEAASPGTYRLARIRLNGSTIIASTVYAPSAFAAVSNDQTVSCDYQLAVNDYVELVVQHNAGAGGLQILSSGNYSPEFMMRWVSF